MGRPRIHAQSPAQDERQRRLEAALFIARETQTTFAAKHGFVIESIWRWIRDGDPGRLPPSGRAHSAQAFAEALNIDIRYLKPGGPSLLVKPKPYRPASQAAGKTGEQLPG